MKETTIRIFSDKEDELVRLLKKTGMRIPGAKLLVFLMRTPEASLHAIEREADFRQSELSAGVKELTSLGWIRRHTVPSVLRHRPETVIGLSVPVATIFASIEEKITRETGDRLERIRSAKRSIVRIAG